MNTAAASRKPNLDSVPLCLVVPLMRVADKLGSTDDFRRLEDAGPAYAGKFPGWLSDLETELTARRSSGAPQPPEAWAEELLLGREARRKLAFTWDDNKEGGALVSSLRDPTGGDKRFGGAISAQTITGALMPEGVLVWYATTPSGTANGQVVGLGQGPRAIAAAKKAVEHAFLAAWESMS